MKIGRVLRKMALVVAAFVAFVVVALAALLLTHPLWAREWIKPVPGVRMEPARPILRETDLPPDSAFKLLRSAISLMPPEIKSSRFGTEMMQVRKQGWQPGSAQAVADVLNK